MTDKKKRKIGELLFIWGCLAWPLGIYMFFYITINGGSILMAFQHVDADYNFVFYDAAHLFDNFKSVFANFSEGGSLLATSIWNNVKMFFLTLIIGFPLNMVFGYYLFKRKLGHNMVRFVVMTPSLLSGMVMCLLFMKFTETALPDLIVRITGSQIGSLMRDEGTAFGMIVFYVLWTGFTTSLILYPNSMNAIDNSIIESALMDGANVFQELFYIIIPLIHPTITTFFVTGIAGIFVNAGPLFAFYYRSAPSHVWTMGYYLYVQTLYGTGEVGYPFLAAIGFILSAATLPLVFLMKWIMEKTDPMKDA